MRQLRHLVCIFQCLSVNILSFWVNLLLVGVNVSFINRDRKWLIYNYRSLLRVCGFNSSKLIILHLIVINYFWNLFQNFLNCICNLWAPFLVQLAVSWVVRSHSQPLSCCWSLSLKPTAMNPFLSSKNSLPTHAKRLVPYTL